MDKPTGTPITDAVYGKKAAHSKPPTGKPVRKPRVTTIGEVLPPSIAAALVGLRAELVAGQPKKVHRGTHRKRQTRPRQNKVTQ